MKLSTAVSQKILKICNEKDISVNKLSGMCCVTQSTVQSLIQEKSANPKLATINKICEGLGISLEEFFTDQLFADIERDDKWGLYKKTKKR